MLADGNLEPLALTPHFHEKELTVVGSSDGLDYHAYAHWFFEHAAMSQASLGRLYELETEAAALPDVFERMGEMKVPPVKILVHYPE